MKKKDDSGKDKEEKQDSVKVSTEPVNLSTNDEKNPKNIIILSSADGLNESCKDFPVNRLLLLQQQTQILRNNIPRNAVSLDEKYLRRCLELIHISASSKAASCNLSVNLLDSAKREFPSNCSGSDMSRLVLEIPLEVATGSSLIGSKFMGYKKIMRFLDRPRSHKLGTLDFDSSGTQASIFHTVTGSPGRLSNSSPVKNQKEALMGLGNPRTRPGNLHRRVVSVSSTNSTCSSSGQPSFKTLSRAIVHCKWKNGTPCFAFSSDDSKDEYSAELSAVESVDNDEMGLRYVYLFHSRKTGDNEVRLVGKMNVSTSFSVSSTNSKIMEREFVLFSYGDNAQVPSLISGKHKGLQRKVVDAFKNSRSFRKRRISRFSETNSMSDFCLWEPHQETAESDIESLRGINLLDEDLPANLESAAIVVKESFLETQEEEEEIGGWGLKFLKKTTLRQTQDSLEPSSSVDVILPAGLHGGPRTRIGGGPSSLVERWKSDGGCDCGGWDLGCALTVLTSVKTGADFTLTGSNGGLPKLRVIGVQEGLYLVEFQTRLSALQSFSIAVAYIHSQSMTLRPKISN